jgi:hypothetical protein
VISVPVSPSKPIDRSALPVFGGLTAGVRQPDGRLLIACGPVGGHPEAPQPLFRRRRFVSFGPGDCPMATRGASSRALVDQQIGEASAGSSVASSVQ